MMYLMMLSFPKVAATLTLKVASMAIDLKPGNKTDATISEPINILLISKFTGKLITTHSDIDLRVKYNLDTDVCVNVAS